MQLKIYVPKHPLIEHLANLMQSLDIPFNLVKSSAIELTYWLCYEAFREWISLSDAELRSIDGRYTTRLINPEDTLLALTFVKSGILMSESVNKFCCNTRFFYVNFKIQESSDEIICEDKLLLDNINSYSKFLILDSIVLSSDRILAILSFMVNKGIDLSAVRIVCLLCTSEVLQDIGSAYPNLIIYTSCVKNIDDSLDLQPYRDLLERLQT
nr:hypothetical protein [Erythrotrichia longistipitata]